MNRRIWIVILLFVPTSICFSESSFKGLQPGQSTRWNVEQTLGQPVRNVSQTLSEYKSDNETEKIYVQYRPQSDVVERVEVVYPRSVERATVVQSLGLSATPDGSQTNAKGKREEYFSGKLIVLTFMDEDAKNVNRVGYYSKALFDGAIGKLSNVLGPDRDGWGFNDKTATVLTYFGSTSSPACRAECEKNANCMAYSWIRPEGILPGDPPMCYLMSAWIKMVQHPCCISAVRNRR